MFSGIIEATEPIVSSRSLDHAHEIFIRRPTHFNDLKIGDSIAVNGVCLTVEAFDVETVKFTLGSETLTVLGPAFKQWLHRPVNLERSLTFGARVHGHLVTGHVEAMAPVLKSEPLGDNWMLTVGLSEGLRKFCWPKGSVALNGVSLTVNAIANIDHHQSAVEVCLIPETQKRTNLSQIKVGDLICFESDSFAKAVAHAVEQSLQSGLLKSGGQNV
jgi:riboflavin synthase